MRSWTAFSVVVLALMGCGASDSVPITDAGQEDASKDNSLVLLGKFALQPQEEKRYLCFPFIIESPAPVVTRIDPVYAPGVHHIVVWTPLQTEPDQPFDCPELAKTTWLPMFAGGIATTPLTMPKGSGMHLTAGQKVIVQVHLLNASSNPINGQVGVKFSVSDDLSLTPAGFAGANNTQFTIPPLSSGYEVSQTCIMPWDMDVFAAFGHEHMNGRYFEIARGAVPGSNILFSEKWSFDDQPTVPVSFHLTAGEQVTFSCKFDNNSTNPINYGESSYQEMCAGVMYYTKYKGFWGCVK